MAREAARRGRASGCGRALRRATEYQVYLSEIGAVVGQIAAVLRPGGHFVLNAANLRPGATVTPLAWDID